jgi:hypothetical protein
MSNLSPLHCDIAHEVADLHGTTIPWVNLAYALARHGIRSRSEAVCFLAKNLIHDRAIGPVTIQAFEAWQEREERRHPIPPPMNTTELDYFAGQALAGLLAAMADQLSLCGSGASDALYDKLAACAYRCADAMKRESARRNDHNGKDQ